MPTFIKILKSDEAETEERQIARMRKEIERLIIDPQIHEERLAKIKQK